MPTDLARLLAMLGEDTSGPALGLRGGMDAPDLAPSGFVNERPLTIPVSGGGRFLDNFAASLAEMPAPQLGRHASQGEQFLAALLHGAGQGFARGRLSDQAERQLFDQNQRAQTLARIRERNDAFKFAREKAAGVKKDRIEQMRRGMDRWQRIADTATDPARREMAVGEMQRIESDLARLEGRLPATVSAPPVAVKPKPAPKPAPKPKGPSADESRRIAVAGVVADLTKRGMGDAAGLRAYYNQPGVAAKLAEHGITLADLLRAVPE